MCHSFLLKCTYLPHWQLLLVQESHVVIMTSQVTWTATYITTCVIPSYWSVRIYHTDNCCWYKSHVLSSWCHRWHGQLSSAEWHCCGLWHHHRVSLLCVLSDKVNTWTYNTAWISNEVEVIWLVDLLQLWRILWHHHWVSLLCVLVIRLILDLTRLHGFPQMKLSQFDW